MITPKDLEPAAVRVSAAIRKLAAATSSHFGRDCYLHAELGRVLLADLGFQSARIVGFAAWRVGKGNGDVISHTPYTEGHMPAAGVNALAYHAWLECFDLVVDFTTYQLRHKARMLDEMDGGHTSVSWCPKFLLLPKGTILSYKEVAAALRPGVAYYEARPELEATLKAQSALDPLDLHAARLLLANPHIRVFGPNNRWAKP